MIRGQFSGKRPGASVRSGIAIPWIGLLAGVLLLGCGEPAPPDESPLVNPAITLRRFADNAEVSRDADMAAVQIRNFIAVYEAWKDQLPSNIPSGSKMGKTIVSMDRIVDHLRELHQKFASSRAEQVSQQDHLRLQELIRALNFHLLYIQDRRVGRTDRGY